MKSFKFLKPVLQSAAITLVSVIGLSLGLGAKASAACVQYDPNATTPTTPVFNNICNVPQGIGNEPDFVRVRQSSNGNNEDNQNNPAYVDTLNAACNANDQFDVWTYVHNNAVSAFNNNGSGTAVAHNVNLHLTAPLNTTNDKFTFSSSVSASNAAGVQDSATLNCNGKPVQLTLVPTSVHIYSQQYNWHDLPDSSVNSTFPIGSPNLGSGDQWGCWEYRIVVVYSVKVTQPQVQVQDVVCSLLELSVVDQKGRKVHAKVTGQATNTTISGYSISWGDGTSNNVQESDHTFSKDGTYTVTGNVTAQVNGQDKTATSDNCKKQVTFSPTAPPVLPNTGSGDIVGIFSLVTVAGALAHRYLLGRKSSL